MLFLPALPNKALQPTGFAAGGYPPGFLGPVGVLFRKIVVTFFVSKL
jgi:hypothetical protein